MFDYHVDIVWKIDIALMALALALSSAIIIIVISGKFTQARRKKALSDIKKHIFELLLADSASAANVCNPIITESTPGHFLDVQSNRDRGSAFFNEAEQKLFKDCFIGKERVASLERTARQGTNKWRRIEAIMCLGYSGSASTLATLKKLLGSRDRDISYFTILALGQIKTRESAKILLSFLEKNSLYRYKIASLIEGFPAEISCDIITLTDNSDASVRLWGLRLLSKFDKGHYIGKLEKLAADGSAEVRAAACECLGTSGVKEAKHLLQKCLEDREWLVRLSAVKALCDLLGNECIPLIIDRLNDGSLSVIDAVKKVIAKHLAASIPYIMKLYKGKDDFMKKVLLEAVGTGMADLDGQRREKIVKTIRDYDGILADHIEKRLNYREPQ